MTFVEKHGLSVDAKLHDFLTTEVLPETGLDADAFFAGFSEIVHDLSPKNRALLEKRDAFQAKLDDWYRQNGAPVDLAIYEQFLRDIGYIQPEGGAFTISTHNVDP